MTTPTTVPITWSMDGPALKMRMKNERRRDVQVNETGFTDVGRDELGGELDGVKEKGKVSSSCWAQA